MMPGKELGFHFNVSKSWIRRVRKEYREHGKTAPSTTENRVPRWRAIEDKIRRVVEATPDPPLAELEEELGTDLNLPTLSRAQQQLRVTLKKRLGRSGTGSSERQLIAAAVESYTAGL